MANEINTSASQHEKESRSLSNCVEKLYHSRHSLWLKNERKEETILLNLPTIEATSYRDKEKSRCGSQDYSFNLRLFANIIILIEAGKLRFTPQNHNTGMLTDS